MKARASVLRGAGEDRLGRPASISSPSYPQGRLINDDSSVFVAARVAIMVDEGD
jgi:hypothetical protein